MFTNTGSNGLVGKFHKAVVVILALVILFSALPVGRAQAFAYTTITGKIGSVTPSTIYVGDLVTTCVPIYNTTVCPHNFTLYGNVGPTVSRSPASSGNQIVQAIYVVEKWDGSKWVPIAKTNVLQGQILATQTKVQFVAPYMQLQVAQGYFRLTWLFSWLTPTGTLLGSTIITSNLKTDHVCVTNARLCQSFDGFVQTGGYLTGKW
jgi:hypothetical protein